MREKADVALVLGEQNATGTWNPVVGVGREIASDVWQATPLKMHLQGHGSDKMHLFYLLGKVNNLLPNFACDDLQY